jgi:hypothetical protein
MDYLAFLGARKFSHGSKKEQAKKSCQSGIAST